MDVRKHRFSTDIILRTGHANLNLFVDDCINEGASIDIEIARVLEHCWSNEGQESKDFVAMLPMLCCVHLVRIQNHGQMLSY